MGGAIGRASRILVKPWFVGLLDRNLEVICRANSQGGSLPVDDPCSPSVDRGSLVGWWRVRSAIDG